MNKRLDSPIGLALAPLRVCLVDMNAGHANQAMRCFRGLVSAFFERARALNPGLPCDIVEVSPRDTGATIPRDATDNPIGKNPIRQSTKRRPANVRLAPRFFVGNVFTTIGTRQFGCSEKKRRGGKRANHTRRGGENVPPRKPV